METFVWDPHWKVLYGLSGLRLWITRGLCYKPSVSITTENYLINWTIIGCFRKLCHEESHLECNAFNSQFLNNSYIILETDWNEEKIQQLVVSWCHLCVSLVISTYFQVQEILFERNGVYILVASWSKCSRFMCKAHATVSTCHGARRCFVLNSSFFHANEEALRRADTQGRTASCSEDSSGSLLARGPKLYKKKKIRRRSQFWLWFSVFKAENS